MADISSRAIIHIDGDAFFASCEQSRNPALRGKPVITGKERGIASSMSYEAKARGVTRAMRLFEIRKICPDAIILPSDYETYSLLSKRLYAIVRRYTPDVEEYGIDECFADLTGLRRIHRMSYSGIALQIKKELDTELGFTFSVGLAPNKVLSKIASKWRKPSGFTPLEVNTRCVPSRPLTGQALCVEDVLTNLPIKSVWGIGSNTAALLNKLGVETALEFARKPEEWVKKNLSKPFLETWLELNGKLVYELNKESKESYQSIQKFKTFIPPSNDRKFVFSQLSKNIENACIKARRYGQAAASVVIFLREQNFHSWGIKIKLSRKSAFPSEILSAIEKPFDTIFSSRKLYRQTGIVLLGLEDQGVTQCDLFGDALKVEKLNNIYIQVDELREKFGKHVVSLGSSFRANVRSLYPAKSLCSLEAGSGDRYEKPERQRNLLKGETKRKRLGIPMFMGNVS